MQTQDVSQVLSDPLAQELMQSSIPARLAYLGLDGFPRAIPIGFHWNGVQFVLCTVPHAPKVNTVPVEDRKSTRLNSSHGYISYAVFCLKKKKIDFPDHPR